MHLFMKEPRLQLFSRILGGNQAQLIMCVPGCGGTGKSQLIRAITAYFTETKRARKLRKLAPTSVAAAEIDGMTVHSFLGEGRNKRRSKYSSRKQTSLMISNPTSFPFLWSKRHSPSLWNNCILTRAQFSKHSVRSN